MSRSLLLTISTIIIIIGMVFAVILVTKRITQPETKSKASPKTSSIFKEKTNILTEGNVIGPKLDATRRKIFYFDSSENRLKEMEILSGTSRPLFQNELMKIIKLWWDPYGKQVIMNYEVENNNLQISLLKIETGNFVNLNPNIKEIAWSPKGDQIAYIWNDPITQEDSLYISSPETTNRKLIFPIQIQEVKIFWPNDNLILIAQKPTPGIESLVFGIDLKTNKTSLILKKFGLSILPSYDGKKLLISYVEKLLAETGEEISQLKTEVVDIAGSTIKTLPFSTFAEKCAWSSDNETLFCAIPTLTNRENLPFSYYAGLPISLGDSFVAYNILKDTIRTFSKEPIEEVDAIDLLLPTTEDKIAFINRFTGRLEEITF
jgi:hypothetical protein